MKVSQLYTYPVKSLRGIALTTVQATAHGFPNDRRFMLLQVLQKESGRELQNMLVGRCPDMALFTQNIRDDTETLIVTFNPPDGSEKRTIEVPLQPTVDGLEGLDVVLHSSATKAFDMGSKYNDWFSSCFGYDVVFAYIGPNHRPVLGNLVPNGQAQNQSWTSAITSRIMGKPSDETLTFADVAAYLVVTEQSVDDVSSRLPEGESMDVTKFRPNIVVTGTTEPYEEDYWAALKVNGSDLEMTGSCHRCQSIDVDYSTGKYSTDDDKRVLKKLMKDRRVDQGAKWSPVFGRYGFFPSGDHSSFQISVGDEIEVTKKNKEYSVFEWPGLGTNKET